MQTKSELTQKEILDSACQEFVSAGYHNASMRTIAAGADVTTGAIYRYYPDKDALFRAVTRNALDGFNNRYTEMNDKAMRDASKGISYTRADVENGRQNNLHAMYDLIYQQFDQFYLLVCYSGETSLGSFVHQFVERETETCVDYIQNLKRSFDSNFTVDKSSLHIICESYIAAMFEPIRHRMPKTEALQHIRFAEQFFIDGWLGVERLIAVEK